VEVLALPVVAVAAGILSFSSPCCLPLLPTYLGYMTGLAPTEASTNDRHRIVRTAWSFVAGFTIVFTILGALAGLFGTVLARQLPTITRASGAVIIVMGLAMLGIIRVPLLFRQGRIVEMHRVGPGRGSAVLLGAAFAAGWTPCIGPILATILATAATTETVGWGMVLLALYSLGLGLPFVAIAVGLHGAQRSVAWLRRHGLAIERIGGVLLVTIGTLMVSGAWGTLLRPLQRSLARLGWPPI
jgi:cytochrome c-type biogenesis protein